MISVEGKKRILLGMVCILIGLLIGFYAGSYATMKSVVSIGAGFIDWELVQQARFQYEHNIKNCYPSLI